MVWRPWAGTDLSRCCERLGSVWFGIVIWEIVDELFQTDGVSRRKLPGGEKAPHIAVGGGVDVDRECAERIRERGEKAILLDSGVGFGVSRLSLPTPGFRSPGGWL